MEQSGTSLYDLVPPASREAIRRLIQQPDRNAWRRARGVSVSPAPFMTLAMAVIRISQRPERAVPDPFTIYRALRHAAQLHGSYRRRYGDAHRNRRWD